MGGKLYCCRRDIPGSGKLLRDNPHVTLGRRELAPPGDGGTFRLYSEVEPPNLATGSNDNEPRRNHLHADQVDGRLCRRDPRDFHAAHQRCHCQAARRSRRLEWETEFRSSARPPVQRTAIALPAHSVLPLSLVLRSRHPANVSRCGVLALVLCAACGDGEGTGASLTLSTWVTEADVQLEDFSDAAVLFTRPVVRADPVNNRVFVMDPTTSQVSAWTVRGELLFVVGRKG